MITATVNMDLFNKGMRGLIRDARIAAPVVVKKETAEVCKSLARISPKAKPNKIRDDIMRKFELQRFDVRSDLAGKGKMGKSGIEWIGVNRHYLTGIAPNLDMLDASPADLKKVLYSFTKKGRIRKDFRKRNTSQRVLLLQTIVTKESTAKKLGAMKAKNRGRLAASWLPAITLGPLKFTSNNMPPGYVLDHARKRGEWAGYADGTGNKTNPVFTIINRAKGIGAKTINRMVQTVLDIRGKAMAKNALFFTKGKKHIADYSK